MAFTKKIPEWNASGVEPPQSLKDSGWKPGVKPAADHFNWLQTTASEAIKELQQKAGEVKKVNGQLPDANGNVNVNIDTSKLATKEELSSASTYIQQEMNDLEQTVAAHQTDLASQTTGKGASLIGIEDSANQFTATTVEGALTELFTSVSNGKNQVANAITQKGQTASGSDTFAQLATAIGNIVTGKAWASGSIASNTSNELFNTLSGTTETMLSINVSGIAFKPSIIIAYTNIDNSFFISLFLPTTFDTRYAKETIKVTSFSDSPTNSMSYNLKGDVAPVSISNSGFKIPVGKFSGVYKWVAFE